MSIKSRIPDDQWAAMTPAEQAAHRKRVRRARAAARAAKGISPHTAVEEATHRAAARHARLTGLVL